ncbi:MAG: class I SAM-dependent methyltransferase [Candidatus Omnitrophica bacterium]|nr:class I SAM-dependent methyltransferase [Candidatus Omnitrophota bacterium]
MKKGNEALCARLSVWGKELLVRLGRCAGCGCEESRPAVGREDGLQILECAACGLAYVDPRPSSEQLKEYYSSDYFQVKKDFFHGQDYCQARDQSVSSGTVTGYRQITAKLELEGKSILDVGCGSGALLESLKPHRPARLVGIDVAEHPLEFGRKRYGLELTCAALEKAGFAHETFDLLLMIDLIEHVENLPSFLREAMQVLRPAGKIFVLTPNYEAFRRAGSHWVELHKDFEHLQYFSRSSMAVLAGRAGLRLVDWWTEGLPVFLRPYPKRWLASLHRFLFPHISAGNLIRRIRYGYLAGREGGHDLCVILQKIEGTTRQ